MNDERILRLICDHTGKRINLPNFTLDELKDFARAVLADDRSESALDRIDGSLRDELNSLSPLEKLRYFCSMSMKNGTDWVDCQPLFDALERQLVGAAVAQEKDQWDAGRAGTTE